MVITPFVYHRDGLFPYFLTKQWMLLLGLFPNKAMVIAP